MRMKKNGYRRVRVKPKYMTIISRNITTELDVGVEGWSKAVAPNKV